MGNQKPQIIPRKPRFQNQCAAKTIEKTNNKNRKTKISEPMGSQNHRENNNNKKTKISVPMGNNNHRENQQTKTNKMSGSMVLVHDQWFWNLVFVCFGFVFSMAFVTHWFWNLGFLRCCGFLDGFGYPLVLKSWFLFCCFLYGFCYPIYYFSRLLFALPTRMSNGMLPACSRDV